MAGPNGITFPVINVGGGAGGKGGSNALQTVELKMYHDLVNAISSGK